MNARSLLSITTTLAAVLGFAIPAALPEMLAAAAPEAYEYTVPADPSVYLDGVAVTAANMFFQ